MKAWTMDEIRFVKANLHLSDKELSSQLDRTPSSVQAMRKRQGIFKPSDGRFQKDIEPWNKGVSFNAGGRSHLTRFKKGNTPPNTRHDFAISIRRENGTPYQYIRLSLGNWMALHRWVWTLQYGEIPPGHVVRFKDGDTLNCDIENLEVLSLAEHLRRNYDREKQAASMRKRWKYVKALEAYGVKTKLSERRNHVST